MDKKTRDLLVEAATAIAAVAITRTNVPSFTTLLDKALTSVLEGSGVITDENVQAVEYEYFIPPPSRTASNDYRLTPHVPDIEYIRSHPESGFYRREVGKPESMEWVAIA